MMADDASAKRAILFTNGMLAVFDQYGRQMPDYQGIGTDMIPKLRRDFPRLKIEGMDWNTDIRPGFYGYEAR